MKFLLLTAIVCLALATPQVVQLEDDFKFTYEVVQGQFHGTFQRGSENITENEYYAIGFGDHMDETQMIVCARHTSDNILCRDFVAEGHSIKPAEDNTVTTLTGTIHEGSYSIMSFLREDWPEGEQTIIWSRGQASSLEDITRHDMRGSVTVNIPAHPTSDGVQKLLETL